MIGILTPILISMSPNQMVQDIRNWEAEQNRTPAEESINRSLLDLEWEEDGSNGSTVKEELLQLPSDKDRESPRRGYDR